MKLLTIILFIIQSKGVVKQVNANDMAYLKSQGITLSYNAKNNSLADNCILLLAMRDQRNIIVKR